MYMYVPVLRLRWMEISRRENYFCCFAIYFLLSTVDKFASSPTDQPIDGSQLI